MPTHDSLEADGGAAAGDTARLVRALLDPACYPHPAGPIELIETHISYVLLTGQFAYKIKKPLRLPFLDFSTLERRRRFCVDELNLNRRLAPSLYLDVVPIGGTTDAPEVGREPAIEHAVKLLQFDPAATADRLIERGRLDRGHFERLAETIAQFHLDAPQSDGKPSGRLAIENVGELAAVLESAGVELDVADLDRYTRRSAASLGELFAARRASGAVREGHGDLHLENIVLHEGALLPFDALEFDRRMRSLDVIDEAAFTFMDLTAHASPDLAHAFLNRYLEITGDYRGTACFGFYVLYRTLVRAKVRAIKAAQANAPAAERVAPYLALARRLMQPHPQRLVLTYGLSGSGKTTVTDALICRLPALRLRSDLERKRLAGVDPLAHEDVGVGEGRYDPAATEATYAALVASADSALSGGLDVIVDATFLNGERRRAFAPIAARHGARLVVLACHAPEAVLRERIRARAAARRDASEATEAVLDAQLRDCEPPSPSEGASVVPVETVGEIDYDALAKIVRHG